MPTVSPDPAARRVALAAASTAMVVGFLGLVGWAVGADTLRGVTPGGGMLNPVSAALLLMLGASAWLGDDPRTIRRILAAASGLVPALFGLVSLASVFVGLAARERTGLAAGAFPGTLAVIAAVRPTAALDFILLGAARLAHDSREPGLRRFSEACAMLAGALALVSLVGYAYGVSIQRVGSFGPMAFHAAVGLLALSVAGVAGVPDSVLAGLLAAPPPGGTFTRRLLPALLVMIFVLQWLGALAERAGVYDAALGDAVQALASGTLLTALVLWSARAVNRTMSDRRQAEERLRESERGYRRLVDNAPIGIFRSTADGRILAVNPALVAMLGYESATQVLRLDLPQDVYVRAGDREALVAQLDHQPVASGEVGWRRADGSTITVQVRLRRVRDDAGSDWVEGLAEDVTRQRSLESQFRQAQRLEAVGRLAGGVAHDFNNILTAITGYSDMLLEELPPGDSTREDVEEIRTAATRAASLTRQLLAFSRKQVLQARVLDVNDLIRTIERMLQRLIGEDVKLETSLAPDLGAVRADPGQIEQVVMNLAVNARDAMPSGGRLTIETANVQLDESWARAHAGARPGPYVLLAVSDTGIGMDADTRSHLFEPFFTTKEQGKGTGLGLATVYGIVQQSGGQILVYSEPTRGTTFKIYLPHVAERVEALSAAAAEQPAAGGREAVLLAEDDPAVRELAAAVLARRGYRVLRAPDGQSALEMARAHQGTLDLLVTDIIMPGMTGRDLAEALAAERPGLRVLFMSGYTDDAVVRHGVLEHGQPYLQKPFSPEDLAHLVRELLDRPPG